MRFIRKIMPLCAAALLSSCVSAPDESAPVWVTDIGDVYAEAEYVARLGEGADAQLAKADALKNISEYLDTKVRTEGVAVRTVSADASSNYVSSAVQTIRVQSDADLFCVEYEYYYDRKSKKHYCAAFISREKYWASVEPQIENKKYGFEKFYTAAEKMLMEAEPILARKYFMLAQNQGQKFEDAVVAARLIAGKKADVYAENEQKFFGIAKRIKDAEIATAIFMEVQGDFSGMIESKVKSLFENEKYSFTDNKKNCSHIMTVSIDRNTIISDKGTEDEVISVAPSVTLTLTNPYEKQNLFSFSRKAERGLAYTQNAAIRRGYVNLCEILETDLLKNFQAKMLEY